MKQAEQKKVLTDFRSGAFNTLVATCIGEEGLDIPQVQLHTALESLRHQCKASMRQQATLWPASFQ